MVSFQHQARRCFGVALPDDVLPGQIILPARVKLCVVGRVVVSLGKKLGIGPVVVYPVSSRSSFNCPRHVRSASGGDEPSAEFPDHPVHNRNILALHVVHDDFAHVRFGEEVAVP